VTTLVLAGVPLAALVVVLLLGFVGCTGDEFTTSAPAPFDDVVNAVPSLVSFWHLGEPSGPTAVDSKSGHNGTYQSAPVAADLAHQSAGAPGTIAFDQPTLISNEPAKRSIRVNGGYAEVPFSADLNTPHFTIQAFVLSEWTTADPPAYRCAIFSEESAAGVRRGYSLYANPDNKWEVFVGDGTNFNSVAADGPISLGATDYVVATYDGTTLTLYVNNETRGSAALAFQPNTGNPLAIGQALPGAFNPAYPFVGRLEEVAYYNEALDQDTIFNIGLATAVDRP
jgi:hypothetical protein